MWAVKVDHVCSTMWRLLRVSNDKNNMSSTMWKAPNIILYIPSWWWNMSMWSECNKLWKVIEVMKFVLCYKINGYSAMWIRNIGIEQIWTVTVMLVWKITKNYRNWVRGWIIYEIEAEWVYFHMKETEQAKELYIWGHLNFIEAGLDWFRNPLF